MEGIVVSFGIHFSFELCKNNVCVALQLLVNFPIVCVNMAGNRVTLVCVVKISMVTGGSNTASVILSLFTA